ncbi:MAG: cell wall hydrolase [Alphaproteobacteria bacterium]|nr:cell wall hydrolase [Alphaproteobacteria bacterium]
MQSEQIRKADDTMALACNVARVVYAETSAKSLRVVEALTSMISNQSKRNNTSIEQIIFDENQFESLNKSSARHDLLNVSYLTREYQMCLRVAVRMLHGNLTDMCYGAVKFHRQEFLPQWAVARGYIADIDGLLFYL